MAPYTPPSFKSTSFNCPNCGSYAHQSWYFLSRSSRILDGFMTNRCKHCKEYMIWKDEKMVYPSLGNTPIANDDMPNEIKCDYNEARMICNISPRSACTLLRLCIEKICKDKRAEGRNLNEQIIFLCEHGLDHRIEKRLHAIRVIGNNAAHPLTMDLKDDVNTAETLFIIINQIVESLYTADKVYDEIDRIIPESKKVSK